MRPSTPDAPNPDALCERESVYLDLLRVLSALVVVYGHAVLLFDMPHVALWGHQAVMVFFVLSGYVICHVADTRERGFKVFMIARLARLWSVLLPALLLTLACDFVGRRFGHDPRAYAGIPIDWPAIRLGAAATFLSESWVSIQPLSNGATWSLCAEFWYYVLFALWVFLPRGPVRSSALVACALLAGFKALLLLPIWLMGVALERWLALRRHPEWLDWVLWSVSLSAIGFVCVTRAYDPAIGAMRGFAGPFIFRQLAEAWVFWMDWLFGLLVAAHLLASRRVMLRLPLERVAAPIRAGAGVSFAIYLFHLPLLHLSAALLPEAGGWAAMGLTLVACGLLGWPAERSKRAWRRALTHLSAWAMPPLQAGAAAGGGV
jgi:peptidoglycan/LPS O-acetylase OafA/YrhL